MRIYYVDYELGETTHYRVLAGALELGYSISPVIAQAWVGELEQRSAELERAICKEEPDWRGIFLIARETSLAAHRKASRGI